MCFVVLPLLDSGGKLIVSLPVQWSGGGRWGREPFLEARDCLLDFRCHQILVVLYMIVVLER